MDNEQIVHSKHNMEQQWKRYMTGLFFLITILAAAAAILRERVNALAAEAETIANSISSEGTWVAGSEPDIPVDANAGAERKRVYLTFDDGPSIYTDEILDILSANDVKATFFVIAREDEKYWDSYTRILEEGHTLGMHSYTHDYDQIYSSLEGFETDVSQLSQFLYERTGEIPTIYRFPGGSSNSVSAVPIEECVAYLNEQGITYYDWNALNGDAVSSELSPDTLIQNIMKSVRQNRTSIILMHDIPSRHTTVESLQGLIDTLKAEGYEILPIDENAPLIQFVPYDTGFEEAAD